jgi:hypothetical protein
MQIPPDFNTVSWVIKKHGRNLRYLLYIGSGEALTHLVRLDRFAIPSTAKADSDATAAQT